MRHRIIWAFDPLSLDSILQKRTSAICKILSLWQSQTIQPVSVIFRKPLINGASNPASESQLAEDIRNKLTSLGNTSSPVLIYEKRISIPHGVMSMMKYVRKARPDFLVIGTHAKSPSKLRRRYCGTFCLNAIEQLEIPTLVVNPFNPNTTKVRSILLVNESGTFSHSSALTVARWVRHFHSILYVIEAEESSSARPHLMFLSGYTPTIYGIEREKDILVEEAWNPRRSFLPQLLIPFERIYHPDLIFWIPPKKRAERTVLPSMLGQLWSPIMVLPPSKKGEAKPLPKY